MELLNVAIDKNRQQTRLTEIDQHDKKIEGLIASYEKTELQPFEKEHLPQLKEEIGIYRTERQKALDLSLSGKPTEGYQYFIRNGIAHLDKANQLLTELADFTSQNAAEINSQGKQDSSFAIKIILKFTVILLMISLLIGWAISRLIAKRLHNVVTTLKNVAQGDLAQTIQVTTEDEIGELGQALNATIQHLRNLVSHIAQSSEQLAASSEELTSGAEQSAQATAQIA
jgi:methyl-accepting chemotaxis protein